jgi:GTP-binding protein LepA
MVFAGLFPVDGDDYPLLRDALERLRLNDASLVFEPENSVALGFGFRCGFLGLLHMEIIQERLEREYNLNLLATAPSVEYVVTRTNDEVATVHNPAELPPPTEIAQIEEPLMDISIFTPTRYIGTLMDLVQTRHGVYKDMKNIEEDRVHLT